MSGDTDVLQRAAAALRAAHDGQREGSGFTRARILASVSQRRRPRLRRWLVLAPLGSALLVGSAWAQSTGSWPRVWQAVAVVLPFLDTDARAPHERGHRPPTAAPPAQPAIVPPQRPAPVADPSPVEEAPAPPPTASEPASLPPVTAAPRPSRVRAPPAPPAPDPELRRFRTAHELHVQGEPRAAIAAYEAYLHEYPNGRFVPEARYNSALDAIKVGDRDAARRLLQPFADGAYGGYRRTEAQRLLEALGSDSSR